ncbi:MAG: hypothetical protein U0354_11080 [Candidatus Sericytochromatia bacterium]
MINKIIKNTIFLCLFLFTLSCNYNNISEKDSVIGKNYIKSYSNNIYLLDNSENLYSINTQGNGIIVNKQDGKNFSLATIKNFLVSEINTFTKDIPIDSLKLVNIKLDNNGNGIAVFSRLLHSNSSLISRIINYKIDSKDIVIDNVLRIDKTNIVEINESGNGFVITYEERKFNLLQFSNFELFSKNSIEKTLKHGQEIIRIESVNIDKKGNGIIIFSRDSNYLVSHKVNNYKIDNNEIVIGKSAVNYKPNIELDEKGDGFIIFSKVSTTDIPSQLNLPKLYFIEIKNYDLNIETIKHINNEPSIQLITKENNNYSFKDIETKSDLSSNFSYFYTNELDKLNKLPSWLDYVDDKISIFTFDNSINNNELLNVSSSYSKFVNFVLFKNSNGAIFDVKGFEDDKTTYRPIEGNLVYKSIKNFKEDKIYNIMCEEPPFLCYNPILNIDDNGDGFIMWSKDIGSTNSYQLFIKKISNFIPQ